MSRRIHRRALLRGAGGVALSLPLLEAMAGRGAAQDKPPKRVLIWYTPNGTVPANFWPEADADFLSSPILSVEELSSHRDDLLLVKGVDMTSATTGPGDAHQKGTGQCLTAIALQEGAFSGDAGQSAGWAGGISVDQRIAQVIGGETRFPSLELGVLVSGASVKSRINYRGPGQPLPPESDPARAYRRLFGDPSVDAEAQEKAMARRRAVLDLVSGEYGALRRKLGQSDRNKVDIHLASIADIQARLQKVDVTFEGQCQPLDVGSLDATRVANMPALGKLQMDLMALAFACDLTRVGTLMWTHSTADYVFDFVGDDIKDGHHSLAHKGDQDLPKVDQNTRINRWYMQQLGYLIAKLKSIPEGDGSVFDNTVIFCTNEQSKGNNHDRRGMPYLLAGSCGGQIQTGRLLDAGGAVPHNRLLVALLHSMGLQDDSFGDPAYAGTPLSLG